MRATESSGTEVPIVYSREETRIHVHVVGQEGRAKIWMEPAMEVAHNAGLSVKTVHVALRLVEDRKDEIFEAWHKHFGG